MDHEKLKALRDEAIEQIASGTARPVTIDFLTHCIKGLPQGLKTDEHFFVIHQLLAEVEYIAMQALRKPGP